jgi:signal-transduction protein with cAMP-binding, CBS, and nucleotidyltransferase domain
MIECVMDLPPPDRIDSYPYRYRVAEVMSQPPITVAPTLSLADAARRMREAGVSALVTVDEGGRPQGILTERDLLEAIAEQGAAALPSPIAAFAYGPVYRVTTDDYLFTAIARMDRLRLRHLAVVDDVSGVLVGILSARVLLQQRAQQALVLGDEVAIVEKAEDMAVLYRRLPDLAAGLLRDGMAAREVAAVLSAVLRDVNARAAALAEAAIAQPAPAAWCFLVLGSGGRGESLLVPDQDNAIVHAGVADDDPWFAEVGRRAADFLDQAGIPYCRGGVMAMNKECRHSLEGWRRRIAGWVERPEPVNLLNADIFYDFRPVHGDFGLAAQLREAALAAAKARPFLAMLGTELSEMGTPLGLFGNFKTEQGRVDLKKGGLLPLVSAARVMALRDGSAALDTGGRLAAAVAAGHLSHDDEVQLRDAHELLLRVVLEQQIADIKAGVALSARVLVARLDGLTRRRLKEALRLIAHIDWTVRDSLTST